VLTWGELLGNLGNIMKFVWWCV